MKARLRVLLQAGSLVTATTMIPTAYAGAQLADSGWVEYQPGGETMCARGQPYSFFVYPGDAKRVVIDFLGGGACSDAEECAPGSMQFVDNVDGLRALIGFGLPGTSDMNNPQNPYSGWTHVLVPYCTGDVHWGTIDNTYKRSDGSEYVLHHRGAANAKAVLDWTKTNYQDASNVFVAGCSAGGYASIFYTPLVRRDFPKAIVRQFADAAVAVPDPSRPGLNSHPWNITAAAPTWIPELDPAKVDYGKITLSDYYVRVAKAYPDVHLSQYTSSFDQIQTSFWHGGDLSRGMQLCILRLALSNAPRPTSATSSGPVINTVALGTTGFMTWPAAACCCATGSATKPSVAPSAT